jgi:hypothetical protein
LDGPSWLGCAWVVVVTEFCVSGGAATQGVTTCYIYVNKDMLIYKLIKECSFCPLAPPCGRVFQDGGVSGRDQALLLAWHCMTWIRGTIMSFDALTIAGMFFVAMSGGFVFATAMTQAPRGAARRPRSDGQTHKRSWATSLLGPSGGHTPRRRGYFLLPR